MARILFVTTKQPSTNPRMRKSADALTGAGHEVHVLYAYNNHWATEADDPILKEASWTFQQIGGNPISRKPAYFFSRLERKLNEWASKTPQSMCRGYRHYIEAGIDWKPELVIGHNPGSLGPLTAISKKLNIPSLFDAEDYHRGEFSNNHPAATEVASLESRCIPMVTAMTAASPLITAEYEKLFPSIPIATVNNAFPKKNQPNFKTIHDGPLKLIWFSQVIGTDRGLQSFLNCLEPIKEIPVDIHLLGTHSAEVKASLASCLEHSNHPITFHAPRTETELFAFLGQFEIGLALEPGFSMNNNLARSNKVFTYPLCGCYTLATGTEGQRQFLEEFPESGELIDLNAPKETGDRLRFFYKNRESLNKLRKDAWELGSAKLNWEEESKVLIEFVSQFAK